jgi:hypothetical protein
VIRGRTTRKGRFFRGNARNPRGAYDALHREVIVRAAPFLRRLAVLLTAGALAFAGGCILGPKQDDPLQSPADTGTYGAGDTSAGGCVDDGTHGHDAGYDACPMNPGDASPDGSPFDGLPGDTAMTDSATFDAPSDAPRDTGTIGDGDADAGDSIEIGDDTSIDDVATGD